jgi:hypothetical protein
MTFVRHKIVAANAEGSPPADSMVDGRSACSPIPFFERR